MAFLHFLMIFFLAYLMIYQSFKVLKLAKNEEKPCSTSRKPIFQQFRIPENPISGTRSVTK